MFLWVAHLHGTPKRYFHATVSVGHRLFSFGGYSLKKTDNGSGNGMGVYVFNAVSLLWAKLPSPAPCDVPPTCCCHTATLVGDAVYVWGGIVNIRLQEVEEDGRRSPTIEGEFCGTLYAFDVATHAWSKPAGISGSPPEERLGHCACAVGAVMYIYGGFNNMRGYTDDMHALDTATMVWAKVNAGGTPPPALLYHSATVVGTRIFVFGGLIRDAQDSQKCHSDHVGVLDTKSGRWLSTAEPQCPPRLRPEGRRCHSAFAYGGELYVFGGVTAERSFNDCWKLNPETFSWKRMDGVVVAAGVGRSAGTLTMCCCLVADRHVVLFEDDTSDDLYVLDLNPGLKTLCKLAVIRHGLEWSGLPHDIRWELAAMTPTSSSSSTSN